LLGRFPVFWLTTPVYLVTVLLVSVFGQFMERGSAKSQGLVGGLARPMERIVGEESWVFIVVDALAMGLWAYLGVFYALNSQVPPLITPVLGVITAVFGGVLRDIFFATVPKQFLPGQIYAGAAAIGATVYLLFWWAGQGDTLGFIVCVLVTFSIRMLVVKFNITSS
jgi:uncharacterized membrane protein YeiH